MAAGWLGRGGGQPRALLHKHLHEGGGGGGEGGVRVGAAALEVGGGGVGGRGRRRIAEEVPAIDGRTRSTLSAMREWPSALGCEPPSSVTTRPTAASDGEGEGGGREGEVKESCAHGSDGRGAPSWSTAAFVVKGTPLLR